MFKNLKLLTIFVFMLLSACLDACTHPPSNLTSITPLKDSILEPSQVMDTATPKAVTAVTPSQPVLVTATVIQQHETQSNDTSITSALQATQQFATQVSGFSVSCKNQVYTSLSPKGNWIATYCNNSSGQILEVANKSGKQYLLHYGDFLPQTLSWDGMPPNGYLIPDHWTGDESYLFFSPLISASGGGTCFFGFGRHGLYRLNLTTGEISTFLAPVATLIGYDFAFSPNGRWLAFTNPNTNDLQILDLQSGEARDIITNEKIIGDLTWSPDSSLLAFSDCLPIQDQIDVGESSIKIFSMDKGISEIIIKKEKSLLRIKSWNLNQGLEIIAEDMDTTASEHFLYQVISKQLISVTPSP